MPVAVQGSYRGSLPPCVSGALSNHSEHARGFSMTGKWGLPEVRFLRYVDKDGPIPDKRPELGQCWLWTGNIDARGYGRFRGERAGQYAHHWAYENFVGPVPLGEELDHLCRVHNCVNYEAHLEPVSHKVNVRRGIAGQRQRAKTHCVRGHPYTPENTSMYRGQRCCRACAVVRQQAYRAKHVYRPDGTRVPLSTLLEA